MTVPATLTKPEAKRLAKLESKVERAVTAAGKIAGEALGAIRDDRLYRLTHSSFEAYVLDRWGFSKATAYRMIGQARPEVEPNPELVRISPPEKAKAQVNVSHGETVEGSDDESPVAQKAVGSGAPEGRGRELGTSPARATKTGIDDPARVPDSPSGASSGGVDAGSTPEPAPPTAPDDLEVARSEAKPIEPNTSDDDVPGSPDPAFQRPLNPPELVADGNDIGPVPSHRQLAARVVNATTEIEPEDAGPRMSAAEITALTSWADRAAKAWRKAYNIPESEGEPEKRRSGYKTTPADRAKAKLAEVIVDDPDGVAPDSALCKHPREKRKQLPYFTLCTDCGRKVA